MIGVTDTSHSQTFVEPHAEKVGSRLNWLRAGVLGANDGIVSVAGLLMGVAATGASISSLTTAGVAALSSGAVAMALGEYVSVSAQRDTEKQLVAKEQWELANYPAEEHQELVNILVDKGLSLDTAEQAVREMEAHDRLAAHLDLELGMSAEEFTNPWVAAASSAVAFIVGGLIPFLMCICSDEPVRVWATLVATLVALGFAGCISSMFSGGSPARSVLRLVLGGGLALGVTYGIGWLFGVSVG